MKQFLKTPKKIRLKRAQPLLGTYVEITVSGFSSRLLHDAITKAFLTMKKVQNLMSFYDEKSDISKLNDYAYQNSFQIHPWTYRVLKKAIKISKFSHGSFDITVAPILQKNGFLPEIFPKSSVQCLMGDFEHIHLESNNKVWFSKKGLRIDLGGIAKGFAVDQAVNALKRMGVTSGLVNAGGDMRAFGGKSFPVRIRHPKKPSLGIAKITLQNTSLSNSGHYFQTKEINAEKQSHLINPKLKKTSFHFLGVGVKAPTCLCADALTKVLINEGEGSSKILHKLNGTGYVIREQKNGSCSFHWLS